MSLDDVEPATAVPVPIDAAQTSVDERREGDSCPVVGIGASAAGLDAFRQLLPENTGEDT